MFERKNQNILSEHYTKLVDHSADVDDEDDFITLKRADHQLEDLPTIPESEYTSKRKQRMALSKKAIVKNGPKGHKLVFDEEGHAHELYEMKEMDEVFKDKDDVKEAGKKFAESERSKMLEVDVLDKEEAKEKKREKKRKRKDREREVWHGFPPYSSRGLTQTFLEFQTEGLDDMGPTIAGFDDEDDGYVSPDFDLPSESESEHEVPPPKRQRSDGKKTKTLQPTTLEEEEELALQLLRGR